jgi:hypothetical protein
MEKAMDQALQETINEYIEKNPIALYVSSDSLPDIKKIIEAVSIDVLIDEFYEFNTEYIAAEQNHFVTEYLFPEFKEEISREFKKSTGEALDPEDKDTIREYLFDLGFHPQVTTNLVDEINKTPMNGILTVYSNYDCTTSMDSLDAGGYLTDVYQRFKGGIKKADLLYEHSGVYGGSLLEIPYQTTVGEFLETKEKMKEGSHIVIPKGTHFGFFSDMLGSGSMFEKTTYREMTVALTGDSEYDSIALNADCQHTGYTHEAVYGGPLEVQSASIEVLNEEQYRSRMNAKKRDRGNREGVSR